MWGGLFTDFIGQRWARRVTVAALIVLAIISFMFNLRRAGERAGLAAERLENMERANAIQRQMLDAASRRPRNRDDLLERLREGGF